MIEENMIGLFSDWETDEELRKTIIELRSGALGEFTNQDIAELIGITYKQLTYKITKWALRKQEELILKNKIIELVDTNLYTNIEIAKKVNRSRGVIGEKLKQYGIVNKSNPTKIEDCLHYNLKTGIFTWKVKRGNVKVGDIAGSKTSDGYLSIYVFGKSYLAHRLAVLFVTGKLPKDNEEVDHKDHIRDNNKWYNLRIISHMTNMKNTSLRKDNKSGYTGISWHTSNNNWILSIANEEGERYTKSSKNIKELILIRDSKYKELGYHENHGNISEQDYYSGSRKELVEKQTPENMDKYLMKLILDNTPDGYHDDHIVPLSKGGLHEPSNIQYITAEENLKKGNTYPFVCETSINPIVCLIERGLLDEKSYKVN